MTVEKGSDPFQTQRAADITLQPALIPSTSPTTRMTDIILRKLKRPFTQTQEARGESSEGLLDPTGNSRPGHRKSHSLSSYGAKRRIWVLGGFFTVLILVLAKRLDWSGSQDYNLKQEDLARYTGEIPWGQARDVDGEEKFWWEQFPLFEGFYNGRKKIVPFPKYKPEQRLKGNPNVQQAKLSVEDIVPYPENKRITCYLDPENRTAPPAIVAYVGRPQGMPEPLFGSSKELGLHRDVCYDRINRFSPYGAGYAVNEGGLGIGMDGDTGGIEKINKIDYRGIKWGDAQRRCMQRNSKRQVSRKAFVIRTWHDFQYTPYTIMTLRAIISELSIASGGEYTVHFLIDVHDNSLDIWGSEAVYNTTLKSSLPPEFAGMGTLWNVKQLEEVYPLPFPDTLNNFSGGPLHSAYRSLHWALQIFASNHPEYDYFWHWEMDLRVTGHYYELLNQISMWAERQPVRYIWERSSRYFIPTLYADSYDKYGKAIMKEMKASKTSPITGPQLPKSELLPISHDPPQPLFANSAEDAVDFISFNPLFDPAHTNWAFREDMTGYPFPPAPRVPTRAALITASRLSRRLLTTMHQETLQRKHAMFPEMFPASVALQYGYKAVHAPIPVWMERDWPSQHANEVFNNVQISAQGYEMGMIAHGDGFFHGNGGSVFGPGEHVFREATYYSNAKFAGGLWRTWLGLETGRAKWEETDGKDVGRMCLPIMVLHPVKDE